MDHISTKTAFEAMFEDIIYETGVDLKTSAADLAEYAALRAEHLSQIAGQAGFPMALEAERDNVVLKAGTLALDSANAADQRIIGMIAGALRIAAMALTKT